MTSQNTLRAMLAMVVVTMLYPMGDTIAKYLTRIATPFDVTVWRIVAHALVIIPLVYVMRHRLVGHLFSLAALGSGLCYATVMIGLISAFEKMPIATAIAIFFAEPLLLTLLSWPLLGERPGPRRFLAVGVGMIGAMIVIRPNYATFGYLALFPLMSAFAFALNMIIFRRVAAAGRAQTVQFGGTFIAAALLIALSVILNPASREGGEIWYQPLWVFGLLFLGALMMIGVFFSTAYAFSAAEASLLAPFQYLEIVGATLLGYVFFNELPDALTWLGTAIILASGFYVFHRERKAGSST